MTAVIYSFEHERAKRRLSAPLIAGKSLVWWAANLAVLLLVFSPVALFAAVFW